MWGGSQSGTQLDPSGAEFFFLLDVVEGVLDGAVRGLHTGHGGVAVPADVSQRVEPLDQRGVHEDIPCERLRLVHARNRSQTISCSACEIWGDGVIPATVRGSRALSCCPVISLVPRIRLGPSALIARSTAPGNACATRHSRHAVGARWFVDETYVKVNGVRRYLYRAVDQHWQVADVDVSKPRDNASARRLLTTALAAHRAPAEVITDGHQPVRTTSTS
ncbi:MAG TPA: hypothetical protein DCQ36_07155 [Actinobacteria bacterium]|nr:hypothetical protein [Actinomycetota bacterium]